MKKLFALVLCLMLALGCTAAFAEGETHTVYLITMDLFDAHWVGVDEGCQAAVAELAEQGININYVWNAPTQGKDCLLYTSQAAITRSALSCPLAMFSPLTAEETLDQSLPSGRAWLKD